MINSQLPADCIVDSSVSVLVQWLTAASVPTLITYWLREKEYLGQRKFSIAFVWIRPRVRNEKYFTQLIGLEVFYSCSLGRHRILAQDFSTNFFMKDGRSIAASTNCYVVTRKRNDAGTLEVVWISSRYQVWSFTQYTALRIHSLWEMRSLSWMKISEDWAEVATYVAR